MFAVLFETYLDHIHNEHFFNALFFHWLFLFAQVNSLERAHKITVGPSFNVQMRLTLFFFLFGGPYFSFLFIYLGTELDFILRCGSDGCFVFFCLRKLKKTAHKHTVLHHVWPNKRNNLVPLFLERKCENERKRGKGKISQIVRSCNFVSRLDLNIFLHSVVPGKRFGVRIIYAVAFFWVDKEAIRHCPLWFRCARLLNPQTHQS